MTCQANFCPNTMPHKRKPVAKMSVRLKYLVIQNNSPSDADEFSNF